ncbi:hypothetical protein [Methanolobus psychrotolerans]|uniref:hypothetical protein n=1 Tax=Methanolobus psychrotolerans TaxID=1874706 RepID=UPI0037436F23
MLFLVICSFSGCVEDDQSSVHSDPVSDVADDKNADLNYEIHNASLKKTAIFELENGYSLKVLEIKRKEEFVRISFRKDNQEYATQTIYLGQTYDVKDPNKKNVVYSVHVDRILDNSFVVELTCTIRPEIDFDSSVPESMLEAKAEVKIDTDTMTRTYTWDYDAYEFTIQSEYYIDAYDDYSERSRARNYDRFVTDPYDDELISQISSQLEDLAHNAGYGDDEIPYIAMTFVQSLPYISDSVSSGYDEYPRFPFETLYNGGGDCEDSSILLASILYDMGYGVALIELPGHMAVGVKGADSLEGAYYEYAGTKFYYLETTNSGWDVGEIPDEFLDDEALIYPIYYGFPELSIDFEGMSVNDAYYRYVDLDIELENVGSATAEDVVIYTSLETRTEGRVWDQIASDVIPALNAEEGIKYSVSNLKAPVGERYRVRIVAWGSNTESVYVYSDWTTA